MQNMHIFHMFIEHNLCVFVSIFISNYIRRALFFYLFTFLKGFFEGISQKILKFKKFGGYLQFIIYKFLHLCSGYEALYPNH